MIKWFTESGERINQRGTFQQVKQDEKLTKLEVKQKILIKTSVDSNLSSVMNFKELNSF